jgi:hypothetical protein
MIKIANKVNGVIKATRIECSKCDIIQTRITGDELEHFLYIHSFHVDKVLAKGNVINNGKIGPEITVNFENKK